ncbi:PAS domain S-box protein [Oxalobacteraceae bacterium]|nr:PAS domain S-box protein [Oxalobacteraceae bacterium]
MQESPPRHLASVRTEQILSGLLVALGMTVISGWLLKMPMLTILKAGSVPMVFNTALCFLLAGTAILLLSSTDASALRARRAICILMLLLCGTTLLELLFDRSLGVDLAFLHTWFDYGNTRPGRMAPNTAIGFMLVASTMLLAERVSSKRRARVVVLLTFIVMAVGLTGLVGYLVAPDLLFNWARSARMAIHTACGMISCSIALWLSWTRCDWYRSREYFREDEKIRFLGSVILAVATVTVGLVGFVLLQSSLEATLESDLAVVIRNRTPWFKLAVARTERLVNSGITLSGANEAGAALLDHNEGPAQQARFAAVAQRLLASGFSGVALNDAQGKSLQQFGRMNRQPALLMPYAPDHHIEMLWDDRLVLRIHFPLRSPGGAAGEIVLDDATLALAKAMFNASRLGKTGDITICARQQELVRCFPSNRQAQPYVASRGGRDLLPLPVELAIAGGSGIAHAVDPNGHNIIAAYGPLAPGLGFVAQQDAAEVYGLIRDALAIGAPIILLIAAAAAALLYFQLHPLASSMWASEQAAAEQELELRTIMEAAGDGIVTTDRRGVIRSVNATVCQIFQYRPAELIGRSIAVLMPPERRWGQARRVLRCLRGIAAGARDLELKGQTRQGRVLPLELTINQVPLSGKELLVGVLRDVSARRAAEVRLADNEKFLRTVADNTPALIGYIDTAQVYRFANQSYQNMLGIDPAWMLGRTVEEVLGPESYARVRANIALALSGQRVHFESEAPRQGRVMHFMTDYIPDLAPDGKVLGCHVMVTDISARKKAELSQARGEQLAEAASRAKSDFLANMSHEIRTPMNAVLGITHLLGKTPLSAEQQEFVGMIQSAGNSLLSVISDILDFSKIEAGKFDIVCAPFELAELMEAVGSTMRASVGSKPIALRLQTGPEVAPCWMGDMARLRQVLLNLVSNALKFTAEGEIAVLAEQIGSADQPALRLTVRDTGIGMDKVQLERIFQPFEQADSSTSRRFGGTGLGLAISRRLVELMGGQLTVTSQPGKGSSFVAVLPFAVAPVADIPARRGMAGTAALATAPAAASVAKPARRLDGLRLMLVEDNPLNQVVARGMLEAAGATIAVAPDGAQAVALLRAGMQDFDLVLMDVQMPVMDGYAATTLMRRELGATLPILAMSAGVMESERQRCLDCGMNDFIAKPVHYDSMLATILAVLGPRAEAPAPARAVPAGAPSGNGFEPGVFDLSKLLAVAPNPQIQDMLVQLVRKAAGRILGDMAQAQASWEQGDVTAAAAALHSLRGSIGSLGATRFAAASMALEQALHRQSDTEVPALFAAAEQELQAVAVAARAWLATTDGTI